MLLVQKAGYGNDIHPDKDVSMAFSTKYLKLGEKDIEEVKNTSECVNAK